MVSKGNTFLKKQFVLQYQSILGREKGILYYSAKITLKTQENLEAFVLVT